MAHSLEIRVPLVDLELTRTLARLMRNKFRPDKKLMAKCAWLDGPPDTLLNRAKTGFSIPVRQWLHSGADSGERGNRAWARVVYRKAQRHNQTIST